MSTLKLFNFNAKLSGKIWLTISEEAIEKEYQSQKTIMESKSYAAAICMLCLWSGIWSLVHMSHPIQSITYILCLALISIVLSSYQLILLAFRRKISSLLCLSFLLEQSLIIEKYIIHNSTIFGYPICGEFECDSLLLTYNLALDILFYYFFNTGLRKCYYINGVSSAYLLIRMVWNLNFHSVILIFIFLILKGVSLILVYTLEKVERKYFLISKQLENYNDSWQRLFLDTKNPILILNKSGVEFLNNDFSQAFGINSDYSRNIDVDIALSQLISGSKTLKSVVESYLNEQSSSDLTGNSKSLGVFGFHESAAICFEVSLKQVCWKTTNSLYLNFKDISDTIQNQKELLCKQYRNILLTTASHELKNPLNGILGGLELLGNDHLTCSKPINSKLLDTVKSNGELLQNVINGLTDYCQCEAGNLELHSSEVSLNDIINKCVSLISMQASEKNLSITLNLFPLPATIYSDGERIKQIVLNLLSNSVKYTFNGGITIKTVYRDPVVNVIITDTGIGIDEKTQSILFKLFGKVGAQPNSIDCVGAGLGLTISQALAIKIGYGILFKSEPGKGSRFKFSIVLNQILSRKRSGSISPNRPPRKSGNPRISIYKKNNNLNKNNFALSLIVAEGENTNTTRKVEKDAYHLVLKKSVSTNISQAKHNQPSQESPKLKKWEIVEEIDEEDSSNEDGVGCEYKIPNEVQQLISSCTNANKEHNPFCLKSKSSYIASPSLICGCKPIIIVDDSSFNLMVLEEFLKKLGLSAEKAFNGKDACSILSKYSKCHCSNLKCILTDCEMPIMNGFEEAIKMREHMQMGQWKRVPIIAVTAYSDELTKNKCFDCGMDAHISKPVMINELKATLQQYNVL